MPIDACKIKYRLIAMTESGEQLSIKKFVEKITWEENEGELAMRISFTCRNYLDEDGLLSTKIKPGALISVWASAGGRNEEVARGRIVRWKADADSKKYTFEVTAYDDLYNLQKSQDLIYYSAGASTGSVIRKIFSDWGIPLGGYSGPNVTHGKLAYKTEKLSEVIYELLDDAVKRGGKRAFLRAKEGKVYVMEWGKNTPVYRFETDNVESVSNEISTENMITRVKVIGQEDKEGRASVEATVNGKTQFGIRQKIYTRGKDETVSAAQAAAKEIINEEGAPKRTIKVTSPDVPFIRKGDRVYMFTKTLQGYYYVKSIRHDADSATMTMAIGRLPGEEN